MVKEGEVVEEDVDEVGILDAAKEVVEEIIETNDIEIDEIDTGLDIIEIVEEEIEKAGITEAMQEIVESDDGSEREQKKIEAMVVEVESNFIEKEVETSDEIEETIDIVKINEELGEISEIIEETLDIVEVETINVPKVIEKIPNEVISEEIGDGSSEELEDESSEELEDDISEEIVDETSEEVEEILSHVLVHMYDYCTAKIDFSNRKHLACSEIRAATLTSCSKFTWDFWTFQGYKS